MESETVTTNLQPSTSVRMLAAAGPVVWIAVSYVDPGKWAATVEGGARFGFDLAWLVLIMNCGAMLCQYLSARVAIVTGKNLAQICSEEYDDVTSVLIGIGAEISMVALDFSMVLGTAYGLHVVFGIDIFNCVFLTGFDAVVFPLFTSLLGNPTAKVFSMSLASFISVYFLFGVLISQPESSLPTVGGMINKLSGENAYALMGLLGANIMPHNFYLHSSIVQQDQARTIIPIVAMCNDHFFAIFCIFSGIFLVNCTLIYLATNMFYTSGLVSLTLQDALSLFDQIFRSSLASISLIVIMFFSNQVMPLTWGLERPVITQDLLRLEIPGWLHRATIRIVAIIPALYCFWALGVEGIFQVLIFTQVLVALLLPSSVIPLFRVASSKSIMRSHNVSFLVELCALVLFVGMLGLKIVFVIEMIFGTSDWASNLKWNIGTGLYLMLITASFASLCLMLLLATTPLKSSGVGTQSMRWDEKVALPASPVERDQTDISEVPYQFEKATEKQESTPLVEKPVTNYMSSSIPDVILPETLLDSENTLDLTTIHENESEIMFSKPSSAFPKASAALSDIPLAESTKSIENESLGLDTMLMESKEMVAPTLKMEGDVKNGTDYDSACKPDEVMKDVSDNSQSLASDGPGSFRSISGKSDDIGSGAGSLSRLAGLGRAARRQLTGILDEFWGQLFDFHGQATQEAKAKKLDVLLGVDSKGDSKSSLPPVQLESISKQSTGYIPSAGGRTIDSLRALNYNNSLKQSFGQSNVGSPLGLRQSRSAYCSPAQLLDAYVRNSSHATLDSGERRYYSVHVPSTSDGYDQQPATIHGYNLRSYLGQIAREKGSDGLKSQLESRIQNSPPSVSSNSMDAYPRPLGPNPQSGVRHFAPPGFHNVPVSRNNSLKSERPSPAPYSPEPVDYTSNPPNAKKFHSLPDISGLYIPKPDSPLSGSISQLDKSLIYGQPFSRQAAEPTYPNASSWASPALGRNDSSAKVCRDAFSIQFGSSLGGSSLWSKQLYEQFGVDKSASQIQDSTSTVNVEIQLLQSFRSCIIKLLKLEGADWLFKQNDGADEDIVARVAAREKILYEVETRSLDRKVGSAMHIDEADQSKFMSVPNCGEGCVWGADLVVSFGVWCIRRILDLSLMESRPELWGKYTYVLNRLQGVIDLAFSKPRSPMSPCFCLQLPAGYPQKPTITPISNGSLPPPPSPLGRGKFTNAAMLLDTIKDVEMAISSRKGRTGTAAGDVAFPKGKENLASVLKRYKRRLSNKPVELTNSLSSRKISMSPPQVL